MSWLNQPSIAMVYDSISAPLDSFAFSIISAAPGSDLYSESAPLDSCSILLEGRLVTNEYFMVDEKVLENNPFVLVGREKEHFAKVIAFRAPSVATDTFSYHIEIKDENENISRAQVVVYAF